MVHEKLNLSVGATCSRRLRSWLLSCEVRFADDCSGLWWSQGYLCRGVPLANAPPRSLEMHDHQNYCGFYFCWKVIEFRSACLLIFFPAYSLCVTQYFRPQRKSDDDCELEGNLIVYTNTSLLDAAHDCIGTLNVFLSPAVACNKHYQSC